MRVIKFRVWDKRYKRFRDIVLDYPINALNNNAISERFVFLQYTGLDDKEGKEIYEGDIVRHISDITKDIIIGEVIFKEGCFVIRTTYGDKYLYTGTNKIIGNIYNPGILEGKNNETLFV